MPVGAAFESRVTYKSRGKKRTNYVMAAEELGAERRRKACLVA